MLIMQGHNSIITLKLKAVGNSTDGFWSHFSTEHYIRVPE